MEACGGCGLEIAGGTDSCQRLFDDFRMRELSQLASSYESTRLSVDVYCLQHPETYCVSAKSLAAHLTGLAWALERGGANSGLRALQRWLNGARLDKPSVPGHRGRLTIAELSGVTDGEAYHAALDRWARSTWSAYADLHAIARQWIDEALRD